jgi:hypothetical protein
MMDELGVKAQFQLGKIQKNEEGKNNSSTLVSQH